MGPVLLLGLPCRPETAEGVEVERDQFAMFRKGVCRDEHVGV